MSMPLPLRLTGALEIHACARLPGRVLVLLDVVLQLGLFLGQFRGRVLALSSLDLQHQHFQVQLQHLVLNLASLQRLSRGRLFASSRLDGFVESPLVCLCGLGRLTRGFEDGKVLVIYRSKVGFVDLRGVSDCGLAAAESDTYRKLRLHFGESVSGNAIRHLKIRVILNRENASLDLAVAARGW